MIKKYELNNAYCNLDNYDEKIININLTIKDEKYINQAKKMYLNKLDGENEVYYEEGWIIETVIDINSNVIGVHELFYIGDDGRVSLGILENDGENKLFIADVNKFMLKQIKDYMNNPSEWCKNM